MKSPRWDADNKPGAPSSVDVLMQWIRAPSSRQRWHHRPKRESCEEIALQLRVHGIRRTPKAVNEKITSMAERCDAVITWLKQGGKYELYHRSDADPDLRFQVARRCPHYDELSKFFEPVDGGESGSKLGAATSSAHVKTGKLDFGIRDQKRERAPRANTSTPSKRQKPETNEKKQRPPATVVDPDLQLANAGPVTSKPTIPSASPPTCWSSAAVSREECRRRMAQCELQQKEDLARCHLEAEHEREQVRTTSEQKREEIRMSCEKLLSRHKLLSAGVPADAVDRAFPL